MSDKTTLFGDEEMLITASPSGFASDEAILIKGAFYQDGATNYFGYTKSGDTWIKNSDPTANQLSVNIGSWDKTVHIKTDFSDSGYKGEGDYKFKIGFYYTTSGGNLSTINWSSNILTVTINEPDPTPMVTPISTPTSTPTLTPQPTSTKAPTPIPTKTATPTPNPIITDTPIAEILGEQTIEPSSTPTPISISKTQEINKPRILAVILIGFGILTIGVSSFLTLKIRYNNLHETKDSSTS